MDRFDMIAPEGDVLKTEKIALIDADFIQNIVTYRINQNEIFDKEYETPTQILIDYTNGMLSEILMGVECKDKIYCWSGPRYGTFRNHIARDKGYKLKRSETPLAYPNQLKDMAFIKNYVIESTKSLLYPDLEADDLLGMLQCPETFIYSKDKDMKQIPGTHYNIKTDEFYTISQDEAWEFLMKQIVEGDTTDNFVGLRGMGPAKIADAYALCSTEGYLQKTIELFTNRFGRREGFDTFVEMYSLARVTLNRGDYLQEKYSDAFLLLNTLKQIK